MSKLTTIVLALALPFVLTACFDPADPGDTLGEAVGELTPVSSTPSFFYSGTPPAVLRGDDWRTQTIGVNGLGHVIFDIETEPGVWAFPNTTLVGTTRLVASKVAAVQQPNGKTVVFAISNGQLWRTINYTTGSRSWGNWTAVGPAADRAPSFARNLDGRIEGVYLDTSNRVREIWQLSTNGSAWSDPYDTGVVTTAAPIIARDPQNKLEIFAPLTSGTCGVRYWRQNNPNGAGGWSAPTTAAVGTCALSLSMAYNGATTELLIQNYTNLARQRRMTPTGVFAQSAATFPVSVPTFMLKKDDGRVFAFMNYGNSFLSSELGSNSIWGGWIWLENSLTSVPTSGTDTFFNWTTLYLQQPNSYMLNRTVVQ